jgi:hypothetical protein
VVTILSIFLSMFAESNGGTCRRLSSRTALQRQAVCAGPAHTNAVRAPAGPVLLMATGTSLGKTGPTPALVARVSPLAMAAWLPMWR